MDFDSFYRDIILLDYCRSHRCLQISYLDERPFILRGENELHNAVISPECIPFFSLKFYFKSGFEAEFQNEPSLSPLRKLHHCN